MFSHFGWPKVVQSDGDATNITAVIRTMIADHGAEHRSISAYNPRAIGKVEARGGTAPRCASVSCLQLREVMIGRL